MSNITSKKKTRPWRVRLAEASTLFALMIAVVGVRAFGDGPLWAAILVGLAVLVLHEIGHSRMELYRKQRDRQQGAFVALVRKVAIDQSRDYYEHLVPADVLAIADLSVYEGGQS